VQATTAALARLVLENNAELYQLQPETRDLESLFRDINNATLSAKKTQEVDRAA
jgi:ABC-2 type transport system ATP-binding protein